MLCGVNNVKPGLGDIENETLKTSTETGQGLVHLLRPTPLASFRSIEERALYDLPTGHNLLVMELSCHVDSVHPAAD